MSAGAPVRPPAGTIESGGLVTCRPAVSAADLATHHAIRHEVFVLEQRVFAQSDTDGHDGVAGVVHLLARYAGRPAGAVRLFPVDPGRGLWQGDRLCVLPPFRIHGVGGPLVRCAVACAGARGGARMVAHIQLPNVPFFGRLGWRADGGTEMYVGLPHQRMTIGLPLPDAAAHIARALSAGITGGRDQ